MATQSVENNLSLTKREIFVFGFVLCNTTVLCPAPKSRLSLAVASCSYLPKLRSYPFRGHIDRIPLTNLSKHVGQSITRRDVSIRTGMLWTATAEVATKATARPLCGGFEGGGLVPSELLDGASPWSDSVAGALDCDKQDRHISAPGL